MARFPLVFLAVGIVASAGCSSSKNDGTTTDGTEPAADDAGDQTEVAVEDTAAPLTYPPGPYGFAVGQVFPNLAFKGYKKATGAWTDITMLDYYDPDGSKGEYGIYYVVGAQWCGPCNDEADHLPGWYTTQYENRGGVILTAIIENASRQPATQATVDQWIAKHHINFDIFADGNSDSLPKTGSVGLPYNFVLNPRNMTVFKVIQGENPTATTVIPLNVMMKANGAPPLDGGA